MEPCCRVRGDRGGFDPRFPTQSRCGPPRTADLALDQVAAGTLGSIFETGSVAAEEVSFLYSLDMGNTGREYQSKPIHNIAGLGIANGDRPMRPFAKPIVFEPRSFIRLQIEETLRPARARYSSSCKATKSSAQAVFRGEAS